MLLTQHAAACPLLCVRVCVGAFFLLVLRAGGGFIFMGWVFEMLAELKSPEADGVRSRIAGVIMDSSPAMVTADVSSRALVAAALGRPAEGIEQALPWLVRPAAAIVDGYLRLPFVNDALVGMERAWMQQAPPCPMLFLYSDADVLVQPHVVEAFMAQQQKRGSPTYSFKWRDSAHVDHYRKYPDEYRQQLEQFAQRALGNWVAKKQQQHKSQQDKQQELQQEQQKQDQQKQDQQKQDQLLQQASVEHLDI